MSSDKKALPSERIKDIADGYVANYPEAIMIFLDEQAELLDTHTENETKAHKPNTCACPCHNVQSRLYSL